MASDSSPWSQIAPDGSRWLQIAPDCSRWLKIVPDCSRWPQIAPDCSRWPQIAQMILGRPTCPHMAGIAHGREVAVPLCQVDSIGCPLSFDFILYRVRGSLRFPVKA